MLRREDPRLLRGAGRFVADLMPPGCLHLELLRSPHAAGRIVGLDLADAQAAPGVRAVLTGADLAGLGHAAVNPLLPGARLVPMQPLAQGRVDAVGQPVVAVVAETLAAARDALDLVVLEVEDDTGPAGEAAVVLRHARGEAAEPPGAVHRVAARVDHALVAPFALEPRAALAVPGDEGLTVWLSTQTPQRCRDDLAAVLGLPRDAVRVIAPDVGGAFGGKASLMPEDAVCAIAAWRLGLPVRWCATRSDEFQAATQGRGGATRGELALDAGGRVLALTAELDYPLGHWMPFSSLAPVRNVARILPGPYAVGAVAVQAVARLTAGAAVNIYRGAGRPEAAILMERLMDRAAADLGLDRFEIRRRNLPAAAVPGPVLPSGEVVCSGDFIGLLDRLEAETGHAALLARQAARRAAGEVCGIGLALYIEPCGQGPETASARLMADGALVLATGASAQGQGRETAFAQFVADGLGVDPVQVTVIEGDTAEVPEGIGALASRSTAIGGSAALRAATALAEALRAAAAPLLNAAPGDVTIGPGGLTAPHGARLGWADLAARLGDSGIVLRADIRHVVTSEAWASGAVLAEVAVDRDTGTVQVERITWVDDAGHIVNPLLVEGQLIGGLAQGLGTALMERVAYADGQLLTGSLMDYRVPRAADMPPVRIVRQPVASPTNPLGVKGVGEAGCIGVPAAVLNAVQDALLPFGAADLQFPLTSEQVWRAMEGLDR